MNAVTVAWIIAACVWAFVSGCYRYRARKLEKENRSFKATIRTLSTENETLKQRNKGLEARIAEADKKLIEMSKQYEAKIAELKRHDNCPFRRTAKNRISYCTKEDK